MQAAGAICKDDRVAGSEGEPEHARRRPWELASDDLSMQSFKENEKLNGHSMSMTQRQAREDSYILDRLEILMASRRQQASVEANKAAVLDGLPHKTPFQMPLSSLFCMPTCLAVTLLTGMACLVSLRGRVKRKE